MHGWQANKRCTCAWLVVLGLCPKKKSHPLCGWIFTAPLQSNKKQHFEPPYLHHPETRPGTAFRGFSFSSCKYRTPSATSHCRGCLHKVSICKAKPITVLLAHAKQQPYQCAPKAGPHRCDQSDHKQQFACRWGAANPARG